MGKRRVKKMNISVTGLFKLAGRHKKMDDVFIYHECQSTRWSHSVKTKQTNSITNNAWLVPFAMFAGLFFHVLFLYVLSSCSF